MANAATYGLSQLNAEGVSAVTATPSVALGTRRVEGGIDYIYVYNGTSNEDIYPARGFRLASGSTGYTIDAATAAPTTVTAQVCFGFVRHSTVPTANYFWAAQRGFLQVTAKASAPVIGNALTLSTSGMVAYMNTSSTYSSYLIAQRLGTASEDCPATTATASFTAYVNCM